MKILFKPEAYYKLRAYVHGIDYEISGFGKVAKQGEDLVIEDVKIFSQTVSPAHTEMNAEGLAQFFDDLMVAGEDTGKWKLWWHSHVWMGAYFSSTDINTIDEFDQELPEENWMLSIVTNKYGKLLAQVDVFEPIRCTINDLPWEVENLDPTMQVDVSQEIAEKVKIPQQHTFDAINFWTPKMTHETRTVLTEEEREALMKRISHKLPPPRIMEGEILPEQIVIHT